MQKTTEIIHLRKKRRFFYPLKAYLLNYRINTQSAIDFDWAEAFGVPHLQ